MSMGKEKIAKITSIMGGIELVALYATVIVMTVINRRAERADTYEQLMKYVTIARAMTVLSLVVSIAVIVVTAVMMIKNVDKVKGLWLMLVSGVFLLIFSITGYYVGIINLVLVLLAMKYVVLESNKDAAKNDFADKLRASSRTVVDSTAREIEPNAQEAAKETEEASSDLQ